MDSITIKYRDPKTNKDVTMRGESELMMGAFGHKGCNLWTGTAGFGKKYFIKYIDANRESKNYDHDRIADIYKISVQRFEKEATFHVRYPFITYVYGKVEADITYIDTGKTMKAICLLEEYNSGVTLKNYYYQKKNKDLKNMFRHMMQMLYGMNYYTTVKNTDQLIHRDIKPENIMITEEGYIKYIDFDWSHVDDSMGTRPFGEAIGGSQYYLHPDQKKKNVKSFVGMDIYSLGLVFLYMLCGEHYKLLLERDNKTDDYVLYKKFTGNCTDNELLTIIAGMIAERKVQYQQVEDILNDFKEFLKKKYPAIYSEIMTEMYEKYGLLPECSLSVNKNIGISINVYRQNGYELSFLQKEYCYLENGEIHKRKFFQNYADVELYIFRAGNMVFVIFRMPNRRDVETLIFDFNKKAEEDSSRTTKINDYTFVIKAIKR